MSHVLPSIVLRAPCAARHSTRQPLLQLFNGYARRRSSTRCKIIPLASPTILQSHSSLSDGLRDRVKVAFSTTSLAAARQHRFVPRSGSRIAASQPASPSISKLEPAPTTASHTEGTESTEKPEELTWRDYDPLGGMPLPDRQERSEAEIREIFGARNIDVDTGNYILSVLHWRRMSGALIDSGLNFPADSGVDRDMAVRGLQYVQSLLPDFDEQAAGQVWAEEESQRLQEEIQERALKLGIYKRDVASEQEAEYEQPEEELQGTPEGRARTGESALVAMRAAKEAAWEREQAVKAAEERRAEAAAVHAQRGPLELSGGVQPETQVTTIDGTGISISEPKSTAWLQPVERKPWVKYYEERAQIFKDDKVPELSLIQRLAPSLLVLAITLLLAQHLATNYTLPPTSARLWPDLPPAAATLFGITGVLITTFLAARLPPLWRGVTKYMTIIPAYPRGIGIVGAIFRHDRLSHLAFNLLSLWFFGLVLHDELGRGAYISILIASGAAGGFASLTYNVFRHNFMAYIFGASGAIYGTVGAACVVCPIGVLKLAGYDLPVSTWAFAGFYIASSVFALFAGRGVNVDHVGHLVGLFSGMVMGLWWKWRQGREGEEGKEGGGAEGEVSKVVEAGKLVTSDTPSA